MFDTIPTPQFEEQIRGAVATPLAREAFVKSLHTRLVQQAVSKSTLNRPFFRRPAWVAAFVIAILLVGVLLMGPQRVLAAMRSLMGYLPGVGIVDQSAPIRVLAEPLTITREDISITITSATLSGDKTYIDYRVFGVPSSAYPDREDIQGCTTSEYLRLPDGAQLARKDNDFEPVPAGIDEATFVIPCIFNTLPGKTPENWELPLRFIPAPPDLTVMPVINLSPSPHASLTLEAAAVTETLSVTPTTLKDNRLTIIKEIETYDGTILVGQFPFEGPPGEQVQRGQAEIRDASGKKVDFTYPQDIDPIAFDLDPNGQYWLMQFKAAGLTYPLTIRYSGFAIQQADPHATAAFAFDAGSNPQPGQQWDLNQDIQLAGHTLKQVSIVADSRSGYSFNFQVDPTVYSVGVQIEGYSPVGGGGGGGGLTNGEFSVSQSYTQLPTGVLTVTLSSLTLIGDAVTWQGEWSPATTRTDLAANPTPQLGVCLTIDSLAQLKTAPPTFSNGKALFYKKLDDVGAWGLALYNLDGSQQQVVTSSGNWGSLSPDGTSVAYSALDNRIHVFDLASQTEKVLPGAGGFNLHWSPDGKQIAYVGMGNGVINTLFIIPTDGSPASQISDLSYESVIGWSPDSKLYFAAPYTGGAAWKVYAYDIASGKTQEMFTIENGTPKFLNPKLSLDGNWIAYRGRDNSSLYLVHPDGSAMHLLLDTVGVVGVEWDRSGWLGVSLKNTDSAESISILIQPDGCEAYILPGLQGELQGIWIP